MNSKIISILILSVLCVYLRHDNAHASDTWAQLFPSGGPPEGRAAGTTVWDSQNQRVLMFAGTKGTYRNDFWSYDGSSWTQLTPTDSPSVRYDHTSVWDAVNNRMLTFGGANTASLNDLWSYNGTNWTKLNPADSPPIRLAHSAVWDPVNSRMLIFGGKDGATYYNDLWSYNGTNWVKLNPTDSPPERADHCAVWDPVNNRMLVFGGEKSGYKNDLWSYDGSNWTQLTPVDSPPARCYHSGVWDLRNNRMIIFGGSNGPILNDVWSYNGTNWTKSTFNDSPVERYNHCGTWDMKNNRMIIFSGYKTDYLTDLWQLARDTSSIYLISGNSQTRTVGKTLPTALKVQVKSDLKVISGETVTFKIISAGLNNDGKLSPDNNNGVTMEQVATNSSGYAEVTLQLDTKPGQNRVTAEIASGDVRVVTFDIIGVVDNGNAFIEIISGNNQTATVTQMLASPLVVRVKDIYDNVLTGATVYFGTSGGTLGTSSGSTNDSGQLQTYYTFDGNGGAHIVTVWVNTVGLTKTATFDMTANSGAVDRIEISSGNNQSGTIAKMLSLPLQVKVIDQYGGNVSGTTVSFAVTYAGGTLSSDTAVTSSAGIAGVYFTFDATLGSHKVCATISTGNTKRVTFDMTAGPGEMDKIEIVSGNNQTGTVNQSLSVPLQVRVTDQYGNGLSLISVSFAVVLQSGTLSENVITGVTGIADAYFTFDNNTGAHKVRASISTGTTKQATFDMTANAGEVDRIEILSGNNQTGTIAKILTSPLQVKVIDQYGGNVSGALVSFAVTYAGGTLSSDTAVTSSGGTAGVYFTFDATLGSHKVCATISSGNTKRVTFDMTAEPGEMDKIEIVSGNNQTGTVNQMLSSPLQVRVTDQYGNGLSLISVSFAVVLQSGTLSGNVITGVTGIADAYFTFDNNPGAHKVRASISVGTTKQVTFDMTAVASISDKIEIVSGNSQTNTVNKMLTSALVVKVTDQYSNALSGITVNYSIAVGSGTLSGSSVATDSAGMASAYYTFDTVSGAHSVKAYISSGTTREVTFDMSANHAGIDRIEISGGNNQTGAMSQMLSNPLVAKVSDQYGNAISNILVSFAIVYAGGTLSNDTRITDTNGNASVYYTFDGASGSHKVMASISSGTTKSVTFEITASSVAIVDKIEIASGNNQTGPPNKMLTETIKVKITDTVSNAVAGVSVSFAVISGGGTLSATTVVSDVSGYGEVNYTFDETPGIHKIKASIDTGTIREVTFELTMVPPAIETISPSSGFPEMKVTITGTGFTDNQNSSNVVFSDKTVNTIESWSSAKIVCRLPADVSGQGGDIAVVVNGMKSNVKYFTLKTNGSVILPNQKKEIEITPEGGNKVYIGVNEKTFTNPVIIELSAVNEKNAKYEKAKNADNSATADMRMFADNPGVEINATNEDGATLAESDFKDNLVLRLYYFGIPPEIENMLKIVRLDESAEKWAVEEKSQVNTTENYVSLELNHFSVYRVTAIGSDSMGNVIAYPNPWKNGTAVEDAVKFINVSNQCSIQIYDISGNLVYEESFENTGGGIRWGLKNSAGAKVVSGYYIYLIKTKDGKQKAVGKILILR